VIAAFGISLRRVVETSCLPAHADGRTRKDGTGCIEHAPLLHRAGLSRERGSDDESEDEDYRGCRHTHTEDDISGFGVVTRSLPGELSRSLQAEDISPEAPASSQQEKRNDGFSLGRGSSLGMATASRCPNQHSRGANPTIGRSLDHSRVAEKERRQHSGKETGLRAVGR
jgi:hypothetical protein